MVATDNEDDPQEKKEDAIFCRRCGQLVTNAAHGVAVNGSSEHTFFNPAGIVFEIRCFQSAPGCRVEGLPSAEFTWFAGFRWQLALCLSCLAHLGWFFSDQDGPGFFGLIRNRLLEK